MKNNLIIIFIISIISLKCNTVNDPVPEILYNIRHPLCIIDADGQNYQILDDEIANYENAFLHSLNNDNILIMWSKYINHFSISSSELESINILHVNNILDLVVSPDNQFFVFVGEDSGKIDLYSVDINGNNLNKLTNSPNILEKWPSFSMDGSKIIFTSNGDYDISYYDFHTDSIYTILSLLDSTTTIIPSSYFRYPYFGSENNLIYFLKRNITSTGDTLFQYNNDTDTYNILDTEAFFVRKLLMSQSKNRLVYFKTGNPGAIAVIDPDGANRRILFNEVSNYCKYNISHDGEKILYSERYFYNGSHENPFYLINNDGSNKINLGIGSNAIFSHNGNRIVFVGFYKTEY